MSAGFGLDTWCLSGLATGRTVTGKTLVAQAIYRRLTTPRGTLSGGDDEENYGFDVSEFVGAVDEDTVVVALPNMVRAEILKDDRLSAATVTSSVSRTTAGLTTITLDVDAMLADSGETFSLTLGVSETGVAVLGGVS